MALNLVLMLHLSVRLAGLHWREVLGSHVGAAPAFLLAAGSTLAGAELARALALHDLLIIAISLASGALALVASLRFSPRVAFGLGGVEEVKIAEAEEQDDAVGVVRWIRVPERGAGRPGIAGVLRTRLDEALQCRETIRADLGT